MNRLLNSFSTAVLYFFVATNAFGAAQVFEGQTNDFTVNSSSVGEVVMWSLAVEQTTQHTWSETTWTYNDSYGNQGDGSYGISPLEVIRDTGIGGVVWHFKSDLPVTMDIDIDFSYFFGNWGGRSFEVYYSDNDDWADLDPMSGGTWDNKEVNPLWQELYSDRLWSGSADYTGTVTANTTDGDFYIRLDLSATDGVWPGFASMLNNEIVAGSVFVVTGTVVQDTGQYVRIYESDGSTEVSEAGIVDTYQVYLSTEPTDMVTIIADVNSLGNEVLLSVNGSSPGSSVSLDFDANNWNIPQTITVFALDDTEDEVVGWPPAPHSGIIDHTSYSNDINYMDTLMGGAMDIDSVYVVVTDDDWTCGKEGMEYLEGDINKDCVVDIEDLTEMSLGWLKCNTPGDVDCIVNW